MPKTRRTTAAWRIAGWTTLAFSAGTFLAFAVVYWVLAPATVTERFLGVWAGTVFFGLLISYLSTRRTLRRVERITQAVARIGSEGPEGRLPEPAGADEIARLARTFNHMLERVQASVKQLRAVTDAVAHDLKSPVTSIRGTLEAALSAENGEPWRDSVAQAIEELDRMLALLNITLDVAEAKAGALPMQRVAVDLPAVMTQLLQLYLPAMADRHHAVSTNLQSGVIVEADLALLNRTLSNLLENELVHLPLGCRIDIQLRAHHGYAELVIEDNGPGFPPEVGGRAFERYVKGKHSPGHGLGLAFVEAVTQAHGGAVKISDHPGGGATVSLFLPVSEKTLPASSLPVPVSS